MIIGETFDQNAKDVVMKLQEEWNENELLIGSITDSNRQYRQVNYNSCTEKHTHSTKIVAWRNDKAVSQLTVATKNQDLHNISIVIDDFVAGTNRLASEHISATFVKSVMAYTGMAGYGSPTRPIPDGNREEATEVLYSAHPIDLPAYHLQNIWLTIDIPADTAAGDYLGKIKIVADELKTPLEFIYSLKVQDLVLCDGVDFKHGGFDIELWQNPYAVAEYYNLVPFSEEHFAVLRPHMQKYKEIGGCALTVTIVDEAWGGQTYSKNTVKFPSMVKWRCSADGSFSFDYTDFDKWVTFNRTLGLGDKIVAYSLVPWTNRIRYFDERDQTYKILDVQVGTAIYEAVWRMFLKHFMIHTEEKGWKDFIYIGIDERGFHEQAFDLVESIVGEDGLPFKIAGAMDSFVDKKALAMRVTDLTVGSVAIKAHLTEFNDMIKEREELELRTTMYTCTGHIPGSFSLSDPGESYWTMLYAASVGAKGYLRWAYDSWVENPLEDTTHNAFEAGDTFLIFPDEKNATEPISKSSQRLEKLAEGVRDVNKILMLKKIAPMYENRIEGLLKTIKPTYEHNSLYLTEKGKKELAEDIWEFKQSLHDLAEEIIEYLHAVPRS
ncbi:MULTISPECIES: DUF4091 domain-containing protein [unclassified Streptococcus]|uniref:DUF4091 domain-containing protein n=1 Tax=unclassified Streptococcus TaxID=2608887 RepID=UPI0010727ACA|nr:MULTISPECIES: DUF4091 domain-containing protein [unclassified Streptococcus]MBF0787117.1 DUF4091 domain-containing protein [Streptococcus sp. 19428wC2_LYSM12]MCQ9211327.1 DUF4091 domain-containing protein [Streptococcus sp. B01]MCQ9214639.1 DUF4091 domain-containing protein [Streptococcus sp. O1]TFV06001.1 DUF4091 domain-containing protein [Streptococcus sp. LYSM12]